MSYDGPFDGIGFTVTAYSGLGMRWDGPVRALPFDHRISGALTSKTSGGNYTLPTYMINPQYCLRVLPATTQDGPSGKTRVKASIHAPRDLPINVVVTWGRGKRVFEWAHPPYMRARKWFLTCERGQLGAERHYSDIRRLYVWVRSTFGRSSSYVAFIRALFFPLCDQDFRNFCIDEIRHRGRLYTCRFCFFTYTPR